MGSPNPSYKFFLFRAENIIFHSLVVCPKFYQWFGSLPQHCLPIQLMQLVRQDGSTWIPILIPSSTFNDLAITRMNVVQSERMNESLGMEIQFLIHLFQGRDRISNSISRSIAETCT